VKDIVAGLSALMSSSDVTVLIDQVLPQCGELRHEGLTVVANLYPRNNLPVAVAAQEAVTVLTRARDSAARLSARSTPPQGRQATRS
jgi:hypothetical protein